MFHNIVFVELRHVELEVADDLGPGFKSFFQHSSTANLNQLVLMVSRDEEPGLAKNRIRGSAL